MLKKIISGGQTGADQGALHGARLAGLETGGTAPKGWRTELGPNPDLLKRYGLVESQDFSYPRRTKQNILDSDGTLIFGEPTSRGSWLTSHICRQEKKPYKLVPWPLKAEPVNWWLKRVIPWLFNHGIKVLNVAGNRESKNPGIYKATSDFIVALVRELRKE